MKTKIVGLFIVALLAFAGVAQAQLVTMYQPLGSQVASDTVTNTGTVYLTGAVNGYKNVTSIVVVATKISGTVGGTISILGSIDGTNYYALNTRDTQTALATKTASDASAVYGWRITGNDFRYYRVSWTGTGTMSASFTAKIFAQ